MESFQKFVWTWRREKDLAAQREKDLAALAIELSPNEYPLVGNPVLLTTLFRVAAFPDKIEPGSEDARLFIVCMKRSPDFTLALITHLRKELSKCKPHKRAILFGADSDKLTDAAKTERNAIRSLADKITTQKDSAAKELEKRLTDELTKRYGENECVVFSKKGVVKKVKLPPMVRTVLIK